MRLAIINDYQKLALDIADWRALPPEIAIDVFTDRLSDPAEAATRLLPYEIVVTSREETRFDPALAECLPNLRLLVTHGMNNNAIDIAALNARGVTVCGTTYGFTAGTAELAWALILALAKRITAEDRAIRDGGWGAALGSGLTGKTLALLGLGDLGAKVARVGLAFGMDAIAWSQNLTAARCAEVGVTPVAKDDLFARADVLSVHLKIGPRSRGLVGRREIGLMKPTALLVNTSRGPIVDEAAMIEALETGRLAGAGLDVFDTEPLPPGHRLRSLANTVLTSHVGGRTRENFAERYRDSVEDVRAWLAGKPVRVLAPRPAG